MPTELIDRRMASAGAIVLVGTIVACGTAFDLCSNSDVKEYVSPDRATKVVVFARDCGATTDTSTQASVLPATASLPIGSGNAFIADTNHGQTPATDEAHLGVRWANAHTVEISYPAKARVFKAASTVKSIDVVYRTTR